MQLPIHNQMFFQALTDSKFSLLLSELPRTSSRTELKFLNKATPDSKTLNRNDEPQG
jgi:hypothetical protein